MTNVELSNKLEMDMRKLIIRAQKEVLEVCSKEYNFDINAAMLLVNAGVERKVVKERKIPTASGIAKDKKDRAKKAVKELIEGEVEGDRKRNCSRGRPKNPEKVVEVEETENLFEKLVNTRLEQVEEDVACCVVFQTKEETKAEKIAEKEERKLMSGEEKETKVANKLEEKATASANAKLAKEAEKATANANAKLAKEAEKATAVANAKLAKEAEKATAVANAKLAKEAEKFAKMEANTSAIAAKEQAKMEAKEYKLLCQKKKDEEKLAKVQENKASTSSKKPNAAKGRTVEDTAKAIEKEANDVEYQAKMTELSEKLEASSGPQIVMPLEVVAVMATASSKEPTASGIAAIAQATLKVKSFKYEGATYFREKNTGAIYDKESNDHLGQWNEATQKIDFLEPEEELEEEEESDGESSDEEAEEEEESA